jgi:acetyl esterase/lipase
MGTLIAAPLSTAANVIPKTNDEWRKNVAERATPQVKTAADLRERLHVKVQPTTIDGVKAFVVTPERIAPENQNRLLIHFHGGYYVNQPGEAGTREAIVIAAFGGFKIISVDYRMPPDFPYPAALDDAIAVWKATVKTADPKRTAIFGTSAGGGLTLATVLRIKAEGLPMPAAIAPGTPWADMTKTGDTYFTNAMVDNVLVTYEGYMEATGRLYANGHDLKDPYLSPIYGDMSGFPPAILTSGTRDLFLSNTVRVHRKLRQAGVEAVLQVFEGQSHAQYFGDVNAPETKEYVKEITAFFDKHLAR